MDSATEDLYFQRLQELIQDEDKIITISSFASDVGISVQSSQKLINKYVEDQRKLYPNELAVTYVLTGVLKDNKGKGVFMVKENHLKEKQQFFEGEPCGLIYSVQKSKHVDFNIIALVDMLDSTRIREEALKGSIVSKNCIKRKLKIKKLPPPRPPTLKGKSSFFAPKSGNLTETSKQQPESSKNVQKVKSGGIADLFKASATKSSQQTPEKNLVSNSAKSNKSATKRNGGLTGFFTNGTLKNKTNSNNDVKKEDTATSKEYNAAKSKSQDTMKEEQILEIFNVDSEEEPSVLIKEDNNRVKKDATKKNRQEKKKQSKRHRDTSEEIPSKKRKRIIERNDSDSDDMFEREDNNEDVIEKSDDEPERTPSPVREKQLPPKNKRRKAVTRNYEDEEGFIVTKTEYIYETASEEENEEPKPAKQEKLQEKQAKPKPKAIDKKKAAAKNQATLMQFFKKV